MRLSHLALSALVAASAGPAFGQARRFTPRAEPIETLPAGPGREETYGLCTACHGYRLVANQGQTRAGWDDTLTWMTQRHNMPPLEGADRAVILDYLAAHHPPKTAPATGGFRNPFAGQ